MSIEQPNQQQDKEKENSPPTTLIRGPLVEIKRSGAGPLDPRVTAVLKSLRDDFSSVVKAEVEWLDACSRS